MRHDLYLFLLSFRSLSVRLQFEFVMHLFNNVYFLLFNVILLFVVIVCHDVMVFVLFLIFVKINKISIITSVSTH